MSFPRAAIRRFNEQADTTIPPIGAYDPKFHTDVAVASSNRGIGFQDSWDRRRSTSTGSRNSVFVGSERSVAAGAPLGATGVIPIRTRSSSTCPGSRRSSVTKQQTGSSAAGRGEYLTRQSTSRVSFHSSVPADDRRTSREGVSASRISRRRSSAAGIIVNTTTSPNESFTITAVGGRSQTRLRASSRPRPPRPRSRSSPLSKSLRRVPSTISNPSSMQLFDPNQAFAENLRDTLKSDGAFKAEVVMMPQPQQSPFTPPPPTTPPPPPTTPPPANNNNNIYVLEPGEVLTRPPSGSLMSSSSRSQTSNLRAFQTSSVSSSGSIFDEIQALAESLQRELSEYKGKLNKEYKRTQELDAKKLELEFINHSLKHQLERYEAAKDNWEIGELNNRSKIDELTKERDLLEEKFHQVQSQVDSLKESELKLKEKADKLEEEKVKWKEEEKKYETKVDGLQAILKDEQVKRTEVETKINQLEIQMDTCYHTCESRMTDAENMKETYEVKIQEMSEQVEELLGKLEEMRRELDTQKTLMDLMKSEHQEEAERNRIMREEQNYIS